MDIVSYILSRKYTNETAMQFGGLKGANCKVKSIVHQDGQNVVTFEWKNDDGETRTSVMQVYDGTPIYVWESGNHYNYGDLVIYASSFYRCVFENSDTEFDATKWNEIGSPDGNYDIVEDSSLLPPRFTAADRKMYYSIADSAFWLWDGNQWVFQAAGALTSQLNVTKTVGGVTSGTTYVDGTSLEQIFKDMLNPREVPTFVNPSASLYTASSKLLEKGSTLLTTITVNFNRGSITPAYGTSGKRAGEATSYSLNGGSTQASKDFSVTVDESHKSYTGTVNYAQGEQPKDSHGNDYSTPLPAGSVTSSALEFEFVDALWANTANIATVAKLDLVSKTAKQNVFNFPAATIANPETFDVPASWTVTAVEVKNDLTGAWDNCDTQFSHSEVQHSDASGTSVSYTRYYCNLGYDMAARQVRVKWS